VYVSFTAEIDPTTTEGLLGVMAEQANKGIAEVYLLLSMPGGQVPSGIALYSALRAMPFKLITHNIANVDSVGNAVFLAGEERYACAHATFMFHGVGFDIPGPTRLEEKNFREGLGAILNDQQRIGQIIQQRTSVPQAEVAQLFLQQQAKDATYARTHGIIHDIRDAQIPAGLRYFNLYSSGRASFLGKFPNIDP